MGDSRSGGDGRASRNGLTENIREVVGGTVDTAEVSKN